MMPTMPDRLNTPEGTAWIVQGRERAKAFDEREDGQFFKRDRQIRADYARLTPAAFVKKYGA